VNECKPLAAGMAGRGVDGEDTARVGGGGGGGGGMVTPLGTGQGLTLVHFSAQPEPYLTRNATLYTPNTPRHLLNTRKITPEQSLNAPPIPQKALTLRRKVDECKPLGPGWRGRPLLPRLAVAAAASRPAVAAAAGQGLTLVHFSAQLKRILWDRGAFRRCLGGVEEVSGGIQEYQWEFRVYFSSETAQVELTSRRV